MVSPAESVMTGRFPKPYPEPEQPTWHRGIVADWPRSNSIVSAWPADALAASIASRKVHPSGSVVQAPSLESVLLFTIQGLSSLSRACKHHRHHHACRLGSTHQK